MSIKGHEAIHPSNGNGNLQTGNLSRLERWAMGIGESGPLVTEPEHGAVLSWAEISRTGELAMFGLVYLPNLHLNPKAITGYVQKVEGADTAVVGPSNATHMHRERLLTTKELRRAEVVEIPVLGRDDTLVLSPGLLIADFFRRGRNGDRLHLAISGEPMGGLGFLDGKQFLVNIPEHEVERDAVGHPPIINLSDRIN